MNYHRVIRRERSYKRSSGVRQGEGLRSKRRHAQRARPVDASPLVLALALAFAFALAAPGVASACCMCSTPTADESLARSTSVFYGRAIDVSPTRTGHSEHPVIAVRFSVHTVWKGPRFQHDPFVLTSRNEDDCGYPFEVGSDYLVYASATSTGHLVTRRCDGTTPANEPLEALAALAGVPEPHRSLIFSPESHVPLGFKSSALLAAILVNVLLLYRSSASQAKSSLSPDVA